MGDEDQTMSTSIIAVIFAAILSRLGNAHQPEKEYVTVEIFPFTNALIELRHLAQWVEGLSETHKNAMAQPANPSQESKPDPIFKG